MQNELLQKILKLTQTDEAKNRKTESLKQCRIFEGKIRQYVVEMLEDFFTRDSVKEMPKASSFKIAKKIMDELAILYDENPVRTFSGLTDEQQVKMLLLLEDSGFAQVIKKAYSYFKLQKQNHLYIVPKNGKLKIRSLKQHSIDAIPDMYDEEEALGFVVGTGVFNSENYVNNRPESRPIQMIHPSGTPSMTMQGAALQGKDNKKENYVVWTEQENYLMSGDAKVISEDTENIFSTLEMPKKLPFVEVAYKVEKDGKYFIDTDTTITDFNVEYCFGYSLLLYTMIMQNFSLPVFSGLKELMPDNLQISPNRPIFLPKDQQGNGLSLEFVTPTPNLDATKGIQDSMLNTFLGIEGIDPKAIAMGGQGYTSGFERVVSMMEKFNSARDDMEIMRQAEYDSLLLVAQWMNAARVVDGLLLDKYIPNTDIDLSSFSVDVSYKTPEAKMSKQELLDFNVKAVEAGFRSMKKAYMELNDIESEEVAAAELAEIKPKEVADGSQA